MAGAAQLAGGVATGFPVSAIGTLPVSPPLSNAETITIGGRQMDFTMGLIRYTFIFDHTQNPVVSLPVIDIPAGIGTSVQVIADMNKDADAVTFATSLEALLVEVH
jgi:Asp-tRNA(Asn)/Glu-tRNA(Gln) amidotransferase A subunit family amidase